MPSELEWPRGECGNRQFRLESATCNGDAERHAWRSNYPVQQKKPDTKTEYHWCLKAGQPIAMTKDKVDNKKVLNIFNQRTLPTGRALFCKGASHWQEPAAGHTKNPKYLAKSAIQTSYRPPSKQGNVLGHLFAHLHPREGFCKYMCM